MTKQELDNLTGCESTVGEFLLVDNLYTASDAVTKEVAAAIYEIAFGSAARRRASRPVGCDDLNAAWEEAQTAGVDRVRVRGRVIRFYDRGETVVATVVGDVDIARGQAVEMSVWSYDHGIWQILA